MNRTAEVLHCYISPGHNFVGHKDQPAGQNPAVEVPEVRCLAGRGLDGDRFLNYQDDYKGQVTFFSDEVYQDLCRKFPKVSRPSSAFRRNIILRGVDLESLIGRDFEIQGVRFTGSESCKPCGWMNQAFCDGAEAALQGRGGLRARIRTDGTLKPGDAQLRVLS